ncbi:MAG: hypothetical protein MJZ07_02215 [Bacteroidales bacterium]|nr:hypothetical protein [Bacteroidales bacterium]
MKKLLKTAMTLALAAVTLAGCQKEGVNRFKGNYSFKTSGTLTVQSDEEDSEPFTLSLGNESGQMDVTVVDGKEGQLLITMNVLGGDMVVYYCSAEGKDLILEESARHLTFASLPVPLDVTASGEGQRYENILLLNLRYEGEYRANDRTYTIVDSDIVCRAKLNE